MASLTEPAAAAALDASTEASALPAVMTKPLHLLRPDDTHTSLVCIPEAMAALRQIIGPVKVCSLVGTQRQGKSSLLNLLHKRSCVPPGFGIGHYMDPKTHGLHFWSKPHPRQPDMTIIYLDTEGLDAPHVDQFYNWTLSAVSLLISDVYMYQSKGSIDTGSIDRLAMILRVAEQLRGEASQGIRKRGKNADHGDEGKSEWQKSGSNTDTGSSFLWLLRDHQLNMKYSPKEEMVEKLDSDALKTVRRCFEEYDCVPLPVPVDGGSKELQDMEKKTLSDLASEFREEFVVLERRILDKLRSPRILAGQEVTGPMLADLLEAYTKSVRKKDGAMADIAALPTQREMLVSLAGDRAVKAGLQHYKDAMREVEAQTLGHKNLLSLHTARLSESTDIFESIASQVLDVDEIGKFRHAMVEKIVGWGTTHTAERSVVVGGGDALFQRSLLRDACVFGPIWSSNQRRLRQRCKETLISLYKPLKISLDKRLGKGDKDKDKDDDFDVEATTTSEGGEGGKAPAPAPAPATAAPLPSLEKFLAAVSKIRTKYIQHAHVQETPTSIATSILTNFERDVVTPDTTRLMRGIFDGQTRREMTSLETRMQERMNVMSSAHNEELTTLRTDVNEKHVVLSTTLRSEWSKTKEEWTLRVDGVDIKLLEERGARERMGEEHERKLTSLLTTQGTLRERMETHVASSSERIEEISRRGREELREEMERTKKQRGKIWLIFFWSHTY